MPVARGDIREIVDAPVFIPLYNLFLAYGKVRTEHCLYKCKKCRPQLLGLRALNQTKLCMLSCCWCKGDALATLIESLVKMNCSCPAHYCALSTAMDRMDHNRDLHSLLRLVQLIAFGLMSPWNAAHQAKFPSLFTSILYCATRSESWVGYTIPHYCVMRSESRIGFSIPQYCATRSESWVGFSIPQYCVMRSESRVGFSIPQYCVMRSESRIRSILHIALSKSLHTLLAPLNMPTIVCQNHIYAVYMD